MPHASQWYVICGVDITTWVDAVPEQTQFRIIHLEGRGGIDAHFILLSYYYYSRAF